MVRYCHGNERGGKKRETGNFASEQTDTSTQTGPRVALFFSHLALIKIYIYVSINLYRKISLDTKAADSWIASSSFSLVNKNTQRQTFRVQNKNRIKYYKKVGKTVRAGLNA